MNRRGFLTGIIAAAVAPAVIRTAGLIMPIKPSVESVTFGAFSTFEPAGFVEFTGFTPFYNPKAADTVTVNGETFRFEWSDMRQRMEFAV